MLIRGSALLGLEPGRVAPIKTFPSTPGGADTPARIAGDGDKNGGEVKSTRRHPGMNVDPSDRDNHSGPGGGYSLIYYEVVEPVALSLAGGEAHPPCLLLLLKHCYWRPPLNSIWGDVLYYGSFVCHYLGLVFPEPYFIIRAFEN